MSSQVEKPPSPFTAPERDLIRGELDSVLDHYDDLPNFQDISTDQLSITADDKWKPYFLFGYGFRSDANCARCPETAKLIEHGVLDVGDALAKVGIELVVEKEVLGVVE